MKYLIILFLLISNISFGQVRGEGRLPDWLTENKAHVGGGIILAVPVYEAFRKKNPIIASTNPEVFQRREAKNLGRTVLVGASFAAIMEASDYFKGGTADFDDWGNTVGGFFIYSFGRFAITSIIQDRAHWRSQGKRLRIGTGKYLTSDEINEIYKIK